MNKVYERCAHCYNSFKNFPEGPFSLLLLLRISEYFACEDFKVGSGNCVLPNYKTKTI